MMLVVAGSVCCLCCTKGGMGDECWMLVVLGGDLGEDLRSDERKETIDFEDVQLRRW